MKILNDFFKLISKIPKWATNIVASLVFLFSLYSLFFYTPNFIFGGGGAYHFFRIEELTYNIFSFLFIPLAYGIYERKKVIIFLTIFLFIIYSFSLLFLQKYNHIILFM